MDVVWLILDSLSAHSTPFVPDGPDTMPRLAELAKAEATVFTRAYVPGPASPSSHAAMFTGRYPADTGMTEASPFFDRRDLETVAGALGETHRSLLVSSNPFVFNGLQRDFDEVDDLRNDQYLLFEGAADPGRIRSDAETTSTLRRYLSFGLRDGKPIRSTLNGLAYKLWVRRQGAGIPRDAERDAEDYQYAHTMNERITTFLDAPGEAFVCANYMDVHPPLDASGKALDAVSPEYDRAALPIGVRGRDVHSAIQDGDAEIGNRMRALYRATIWDLDRKVAPLVESLLERDAFIVVTADHGTWFDRSWELDEDRLHVPLLVFLPDRPPATIDATVNLRSLPHTTMRAIGLDPEPFEGPSLLEVTTDQLSLTEYVHVDDDEEGPVTPGGSANDVRRDIAAISNDARVDLVEGHVNVVRGPDDEVAALRDAIEQRRDAPLVGEPPNDVEYDQETTDRLRELGYLE